MRNRCLLILIGTVCLSVRAVGGPPHTPLALERIPAWFEANHGLMGPEVKYYSRGAGYALALDEAGARLWLPGSGASIRMQLRGGNRGARMLPSDPLPARSDYFLGADPGRWKRAVPHFGAVRYREVYPGIDLVYRASGKLFEYDFIIAPGADPSRIRVRFDGARRARLDDRGALLLAAGGTELRQRPPVVYQDLGSRRVPVEGRYELTRNGEVRFFVGPYDRSRPLVIDPVLVFSGYLGGDRLDIARAAAVDRDGNLWITGATSSAIELPPQNEPYQYDPKGGRDVFVAKVSSQGGLAYWTFLGGASDDAANDIAVDGAGNVYVVGTTRSSDFPQTGNAHQPNFGGDQDAFVLRINPKEGGAGSLTYSSFIGGDKFDIGTAVAVGRDGTIFAVGYTASLEILGIGSGSAQAANRGGWDSFIAWLAPDAPSGQALRHLTFFGGNSTDIATAAAVDAQGNLYVAGYTMSDDFPVAGDAYQVAPRSRGDLFLTKLDLGRPGLDAIVYSTYLGGSALDVLEAIALDEAGGVWMAGHTLSEDFPVTAGAYQSRYGGNTDAFVARLDLSHPRQEALTYATYVGGSNGDIGYGLAPAGPNRVAVAGYTISDDFPVKSAPEANRARRDDADAFLTVLDTTKAGSEALVFSMYFGATGIDVATRLAADAAGRIYMVGYTGSGGLAVTDGSRKGSPSGSVSGFVLKVDTAAEPGSGAGP